MALPIYQYSPLPSARSTRILIVKPSDSSDAPIECELKTIDLDDEENPTYYEALSYVWGKQSDKTNPSKILLHGHEHTVTPNLEAALRHLRGDDRPLLLWVDAICINQGDLSERASQVEMMADIYKRAVTTVSWLGEGDADSDEAAELVRELGSWAMDHENELDDYMGDENDTRTPVEVIEALGFSLGDRNWSSVWRLFERPYWSRVWIIQELAARGDFLMGATGVFYCGAKSFWRFHFDALCAVVLMCTEAGLTANLRVTSGNAAQDVVLETHEPFASLQKRMHLPAGIRMSQVLTACRGTRYNPDPQIDSDLLLRFTRRFQATEPRDKLFAVRGLVIDGQLVTPNYSKSFEEVVKDFAINHIRAHSSLRILLGNRFREHSPSWTPDILADDRRTAQGLTPQEDIPYRATGDRDAVIAYHSTLNILSCRGIVVGTINKAIGPLLAPEGHGPGANDYLGNFVSLGHDKFWTAVQDFYRRLGDDRSRERFWRTFFLDTDSSMVTTDTPSPAPADYATRFCVMFQLQGLPECFMPAEHRLRRFSLFVEPFHKAFDEALSNRTFITTRNGQVHRMGIGPYLAKEGDIVVVLFGANLCVVLRPVQGEDRYKIVGDAWIYGIMKGELVKDVPEDGGQVFHIA
ncbi:Heterokaryon incompatibility protein (HET) domain containing protein [Rhypophila decipiens]